MNGLQTLACVATPTVEPVPSVPEDRRPAPLSYARALSSSSPSLSPSVTPTPVPTLTLRDIARAEDSSRQHSAAAEDALVWCAVLQACMCAVQEELAACGEVGTVPAAPVPCAAAVPACACGRAGDGSTAAGDDSAAPFRCGGSVVWYRSECGEAAFLDSLSMRVLLESVGGSHSALPTVVDATVAQADTGLLTDKLRLKFPFMWSLPVSPLPSPACRRAPAVTAPRVCVGSRF